MVTLKRKTAWIVAAAVLAVVILIGVWTVRPRSWNELSGNLETNSLAGSLVLNRLNPENETDIWQSHIWQLTAEEAKGAATDAILDALNSATYRGSLRNIASYTLFRQANSSYSLDGENSKGEVDLILVDDAQKSVSIAVFSGGMVVFRNHSSGVGTLFFDTEPQVYEALAAIMQEFIPQEQE